MLSILYIFCRLLLFFTLSSASFYIKDMIQHLHFKIVLLLLKSLLFSFVAVQSIRCYSHGSHETDEEFDARWVTYFSKPDIDAWELRKGNWNIDIFVCLGV